MEFINSLNPLHWAKKGIDKALMSLLDSLVISSYWICLIGGLVGLLLYMFGYEKGKNYPFISIGIYLIINIIGSVLLNV